VPIQQILPDRPKLQVSRELRVRGRRIAKG